MDSTISIQYQPPQFATLVPQTPITWVTCNTPSDGSYTKQGVDILSSLNIPHKVIWAGGEKKRDFYVHKMMDHTNIYIPLSCQQQNVLHISLTNDRDAIACKSQMEV